MSYESAGPTKGVLTPAYGRDYKSADEVIKAYRDGKDFVLHNPTSRYDDMYCSCRDFPGQRVELRYQKKTRAVIVAHDETVVEETE